jgi:hypothetical protein
MTRTDINMTARWPRFLIRAIVTASLVAIASLSGLTPVEASTRVTQGDAIAALEAFGNGGWAILNHEGVDVGAPADSELRATIRPGSLWDGRHFCAQDWHVILLAEISGGDASFSLEKARAELDPVMLQFFVDNTPLTTTRTAIKRFLNPERFGLVEAYYFQQGAVLAPDELTVGSHRLSVTEVTPSGTSRLKIKFYIDAPGTGACLQ